MNIKPILEFDGLKIHYIRFKICVHENLNRSVRIIKRIEPMFIRPTSLYIFFFLKKTSLYITWCYIHLAFSGKRVEIQKLKYIKKKKKVTNAIVRTLPTANWDWEGAHPAEKIRTWRKRNQLLGPMLERRIQPCSFDIQTKGL